MKINEYVIIVIYCNLAIYLKKSNWFENKFNSNIMSIGFKNYHHIQCRSNTYTKTIVCFVSTFFARCCCKICVGIQNNEK